MLDRREITYAPSGGNNYSVGTGNRIIRFHLTASDTNSYLDSSSIRFFASLNNKSTQPDRYLRFIGQLHSAFSRLRIISGGQIVEDITGYNQFCELWNTLKAPSVRDIDDIESGMQPRYDDDLQHLYATGLSEDAPTGNLNKRGDFTKKLTRHSAAGIRNGSYVRLAHKLCSGFCSSGYYLPLRHSSGLEIELTLCNDASDPIIVPNAPPVNGTATETFTDANGYLFNTDNTAGADDWELNQILLRAEVAVIDPEISERYTRGLLGGGSMKLVYKAYHMINQTVNNGGGNSFKCC